MKNIFVRLSILTLALTGISASTFASTRHQQAPVVNTKPCCWPGTGYCGMD